MLFIYKTQIVVFSYNNYYYLTFYSCIKKVGKIAPPHYISLHIKCYLIVREPMRSIAQRKPIQEVLRSWS